MAGQNGKKAAQRAALEKARKEQRAKELRSRVLTWSIVGVVIVGLGTGAGVVIADAAREQAAVAEAAASPVPGVTEVDDLTAEHVPDLPEPVATEVGTLVPPVGGEHDPVWQNCGVYTEPVATFNAVHSLEHGAVWVTYAPGLSDDDVAVLRDAVGPYPYTILSPFTDLAAPVVLTAWGVQLELEDVNDERLDTFLAKYVQGEQTPEPGAACSGGLGSPA